MGLELSLAIATDTMRVDEKTERRPKRRVAVVGSGMAGLTTAYLLHNDEEERYEVTVFEVVSPKLSIESTAR